MQDCRQIFKGLVKMRLNYIISTSVKTYASGMIGIVKKTRAVHISHKLPADHHCSPRCALLTYDVTCKKVLCEYIEDLILLIHNVLSHKHILILKSHLQNVGHTSESIRLIKF